MPTIVNRFHPFLCTRGVRPITAKIECRCRDENPREPVFSIASQFGMEAALRSQHSVAWLPRCRGSGTRMPRVRQRSCRMSAWGQADLQLRSTSTVGVSVPDSHAAGQVA